MHSTLKSKLHCVYPNNVIKNGTTNNSNTSLLTRQRNILKKNELTNLSGTLSVICAGHKQRLPDLKQQGKLKILLPSAPSHPALSFSVIAPETGSSSLQEQILHHHILKMQAH
jgi:hypothetical protein